MKDRVALVTNSLEFAGPPSVVALRDAGFLVVAHDERFVQESQRKAFEEANQDVRALPAQSAEEVVDAAWRIHGRVDVLVSNDSYPAVHRPVADGDIAYLRATLEKLVVFPFALAKAAIPRLRDQSTARIVFITSNRAHLPIVGGAIPDAARAAANALVRSLSIELAPKGIPVNAVAPNYLYSETYFPRASFIDDARGRRYIEQVVPVGRLARPEEIGELVRYLATMEGNFLTGAIIDFSGGWPAAPERPVITSGHKASE